MNCVNVIKGKRLDFMDEIINAMDGVIGAKSLITLTQFIEHSPSLTAAARKLSRQHSHYFVYAK